ncbi:hypothetical protein D3C75_1049260 [compost metagenome]
MPSASANSRLLPEPSMIECISTAVSILAPRCCNGYASQRVNHWAAASSWLQRNEMSQRRLAQASSSLTGSSGRPSKVLMYTAGSLLIVGSNTICSTSTVRRSLLFNHSGYVSPSAIFTAPSAIRRFFSRSQTSLVPSMYTYRSVGGMPSAPPFLPAMRRACSMSRT